MLGIAGYTGCWKTLSWKSVIQAELPFLQKEVPFTCDCVCRSLAGVYA